jgi:O-methyltransferase
VSKIIINHPVGNIKIFIIKNFSILISNLFLFFLSLIIKIKKNESEIIISRALYAPWKTNSLFRVFFKKISHLTLLDKVRAYTLWYLTEGLKNKEGSILDVGCLKGGSGFIMSKINKVGSTYLIDTFEGLVESDKFYNKNHFIYANGVSELRKNIKKLRLKNIKIIKSVFPDKNIKEIKKVKICHIDVNTYKSTLKSFMYIHKKLISNGIIIFDDYGTFGNKNVKKFISKIIKKYNKDYFFIFNFFGQCILLKK